MRAAITEGRNRFYPFQVTQFGLSGPLVIGPNPAWRVVALTVERGQYLVRKLAPSNRFQIAESSEPPRYGLEALRLATDDTLTERVVPVTQPWLLIYTSNQAEEPSLWIERIA